MVLGETVKPTRMELINLKNKIKLAKNGHKLLKQKRDALILEFFKLLRETKDLEGKLYSQLDRAYDALVEAEISHGVIALENLAIAIGSIEDLEVKTKNIMGVKVPMVSDITVIKELLKRECSLFEGSAKIDEVLRYFENALDTVIQIAEKETSIKRLLKDIEKTKRRVNAIEFVLIPKSEEQMAYISMRLSEMERESFFSLKRIKARAEE